MRYIKNYSKFVYKNNEMNEGFKSWLSTFLILANLGIVPSFITTASAKEKQEFVENQPQDKIDAALFAKFMNDNGFLDLEKAYDKFIKENPNVSTSLDSIEKYISKNGKQFVFDKKYVANNYDNVDINKFIATNWMTDMGNFIEDSLEPKINNWISDYEKKTSVEIGIITVDNLGEYPDVDDYANKQFNRLGIGKSSADNGILLVFSKQDRKWRIEVGYGLEGLLTDAQANQIGREVIVPHFKEGDYYGGIMSALKSIEGELGTEAIESKKKWLKEKRDKEVAELSESFQNFVESVTFILIIGLLGYLVYYLVNRARLKREEREELIEKIKNLLSQIEELESKFPSSPKFNNSKELKNIHSLVMNDISNNIKPNSKEYNEESLLILKDILRKLKSSTISYYSKERDVATSISNISSLSSTLSNTKSI
jgi:uncharacterized membrane protein YgcG